MNVDHLIAEHQIVNCLARHSRGVDRADSQLLGAAYHPDATVDYGFYVGPATVLVDILANAQKSALPSLHRTSNTEIIIKDQTAVAESYVIASVEEATLHRLVFGRYLDRLENRGGAWRIAHRTYVLDSNSNQPSHITRTDPPYLHDHYVPQGGKAAADPGRALLAHHEAANRHLQKAPAMSYEQSQLDEALSRQAIRQLLSRYCRAADRADAALMQSIFWEDATIISGICNGPPTEFVPAVIGYISEHLDSCFHSIANEWIEIKGDHAVGEHYIIAHNRAQNQETLTGGRYLDSYVRRHGLWRIASRSFICDWSSTQPSSYEAGGFYETLTTRGVLGKEDPVYALWASL